MIGYHLKTGRRGGRVRLKLDVQGQGGGIILVVDGLGEWEVMDVICVSSLKLTVQIQLALYRGDPFLINNRKMTGV